jgi:iron complex transport system permease protein
MILSRARFSLSLAIAAVLLLALIAWTFTLGRFAVAPGDVLRALWAAATGAASGLAPNVDAVVLQVRAPRVAAALAVGAALATAGAAYQNLFKNPLVSPDLLGVSAGCALGAGLAILMSLSIAAIQAFAFVGGLLAVGLVVAIGTWIRGRDPILTLILTGVVVGSLFGAGIALVKYVADPYNQLPAITFWLLGSFTGALPRDLPPALAPMAAGVLAIWLLRWRMDVLALSEEEARTLGVNVRLLRLAVIVAATLVTALGGGARRDHRLDRPHRAARRAPPRRGRLRPRAAALAAGRRGLHAGGRYPLPHGLPHRDPSGRRHGVRRHAGLHRAPRDHLPAVGMRLETRGLAFGYPSRLVGEGIDFTLDEGEITCLLGPNGSGKTTLMKTLLGILPPRGGRVLLEGRDLAAFSDRERAARLAYVPQAAESYFDFSVLEMVEMGRTAHRGVFERPGRRDREVALAALDRLGLAPLAHRRSTA